MVENDSGRFDSKIARVLLAVLPLVVCPGDDIAMTMSMLDTSSNPNQTQDIAMLPTKNKESVIVYFEENGRKITGAIETENI